MSAATSVNDMDRFNMFPFRASPRQADVLIVAGTLTTKMAGPLVRLWEQMPEPKWCVAMGDCTCSGGRYKRSYATVEGIDRIMPVDVYVPGCPPRPEGLIYGMMKLQQLILERRGHWAERRVGPTVPDGRLTHQPVDKGGIGHGHRAQATPRGRRWRAAARARRRTRRHDRDRDRGRARCPDVMRRLHDDPALRFELLADLAGVDTGRTMQVVYHLWSPLGPDWLRVIADGLPRDDPRVPSVTFLWKGAEWAEREAYDMFGIIFEGNRDLRRIYMPPDYLELPAAQGLPARRRLGALAGRGLPPDGDSRCRPRETRPRPVLRLSPGTGAVLGPTASGSRSRRARAAS